MIVGVRSDWAFLVDVVFSQSVVAKDCTAVVSSFRLFGLVSDSIVVEANDYVCDVVNRYTSVEVKHVVFEMVIGFCDVHPAVQPIA